MNRYFRTALLLAVPVSLTACESFLTCDECQNDPNRPTTATADLLFQGVQSTLWYTQTGEDARLISMWMQQMMGTDRQYQSLATYASYVEGTFEWDMVYGGGGLFDIKRIKQLASESSPENKIYLGVAQVVEALMIGTAADHFGDIPYSEAATGTGQPVLDDQMAVYAEIQKLLDAAIANLTSGQGSGPATDLVYGGSASKWTKLAWTLKARYHMHTAEKLGAPAYTAAKAAAEKGIMTSADNYVAKLSGAVGEQNPWYVFIEVERSGYISAGKHLVDLLQSRNDPRLPMYFSRGAKGTYRGAAVGESFSGDLSNLSDERLDPGFDQPIVTAAENLLIWAEAAYQTNDQATALQKLNQARALDGLPALSGLSGTALLTEILTEKYIQLFQTLEIWNDYKRTCFPNLTPAANFNGIIPARAYYPISERQTNENIPPVESQPLRNDNDPAGGTLFDAAACLGQ